MSLAPRWTRPLRIRLPMVVMAACFAGAAYAIRAVWDGPVGQYSGAALSGAIVYTIVVFVRPPVSPLLAGGVAIAYCWCTEFAQLTPVPAMISEHSWFARQLLGSQFDLTDVVWYPLGVVPLVAAHLFLRARARSSEESVPTEARADHRIGRASRGG
ncbi:ribosomal maturation YjgA family protein [Phytomonospora endophytica]|uniref:DUF2809 domain-containing protein n=1 Tax=Phytomonospora endophytica TaxID=714109 RepID=A0A841FZ20_9ACTN|nr:DUF2809 domain-containing protein [Phytomonospora endophytica]MBB6038772.1 hypothetical protein [Phytomonospora endophytica]